MEDLLLTIEGCLALGFAAGLIIGFLITKQKVGCIVLIAVPVAMIAFISWWQGRHPENLRSTSALDFVFGPLWPSVGAVAGYCVGRWVRSRVSRR